MYNVLVSGASGIVGYGILRNLRCVPCKTIGTTIYRVSPADCFADAVEIIPRTSDTEYFIKLSEIIKDYNVDIIIPGIEADMIAWNDNRDILANTGAFLLLNRKGLIDICVDKWMLYSVLRDNRINCRIESSIDPCGDVFNPPFIVKPRRGYGSKGVVKIETTGQFLDYKDKIGSELMMQELVGDDENEYTVSAFFDELSCLRAMIAMRRKLSPAGFTEIAETVDENQFRSVVEELASLLKPVGPTNFQFRKHKGEWKLLEINPRISSSTSLKSAFGYNEVKMSIEYFLDKKRIDYPKIRHGRAIRYMEDFVVYDSTNI